MSEYNLKIIIGNEPFYFVVDESALDYFQQIGKYFILIKYYSISV